MTSQQSNAVISQRAYGGLRRKHLTGQWSKTVIRQRGTAAHLGLLRLLVFRKPHRSLRPALRRTALLELPRCSIQCVFFCFFFFFTLVTGPRRSLSLKLSDTRVRVSTRIAMRPGQPGGAREFQTLVAPKPQQGVLVRGHAGLVINKLSARWRVVGSRVSTTCLVSHDWVPAWQQRFLPKEAGIANPVSVHLGSPAW